jgi:hypothetical protein
MLLFHVTLAFHSLYLSSMRSCKMRSNRISKQSENLGHFSEPLDYPCGARLYALTLNEVWDPSLLRLRPQRDVCSMSV